MACSPHRKYKELRENGNPGRTQYCGIPLWAKKKDTANSPNKPQLMHSCNQAHIAYWCSSSIMFVINSALRFVCDDVLKGTLLLQKLSPAHLFGRGRGVRHSSLQQRQIHWEFHNNTTYFHPKTRSKSLQPANALGISYNITYFQNKKKRSKISLLPTYLGGRFDHANK